jgi:hypothetical protein
MIFNTYCAVRLLLTKMQHAYFLTNLKYANKLPKHGYIHTCLPWLIQTVWGLSSIQLQHSQCLLPTPADMSSPVRLQYLYNILYLKRSECQKVLDWTNESVLLLWHSVSKLTTRGCCKCQLTPCMVPGNVGCISDSFYLSEKNNYVYIYCPIVTRTTLMNQS